MSALLSDFSKTRDNNFNLLRFIAASLVLFSHSFALQIGSADAEPLRTTIGMTWGDIAVDLFFITSGFLIAGSFFNRKSLIAFTWARVLRIYPGLIIANLISVFIIGLLLTNLSVSDYLTNVDIYKFLIKNSTLILFDLQWSLPGVFGSVPYGDAVNGSLWTLPREVQMYALLVAIALITAFVQKRTRANVVLPFFLVLALAALSLKLFNFYYEQEYFNETFVRLFSLFFIGASFYLLKDKIVLSGKVTLIFFVILMLSGFNKDVFFTVYLLTLPYIIFYLAYIPAGKIRLYNKLGDYSYGMYVYAFPVQQSVMVLHPSATIWEMIIYSFLVTLLLAYLSWCFIEKRALSMKDKYKLLSNFKFASIK